MADTEALSASIAAMAVSDATIADARPNLPLPRELRDQIWSYLLRHEHVHDGMWRDRPASQRGIISECHQRFLSRAHTFKFQVNILAVNKSIYKECLKVLKSNEFIIVSHKFPVTGTSKHVSSLPIVTEDHGDCAKFKHHVLRVHFQGSAKCLAVAQAPSAPVLRSFCLVASDLSRFCRLLQHHHLYSMPPSAPFICGGEGTPTMYAPLAEIAAPSPKGFHFRTTVQFLDKDVSLDTAKRLLTHFKNIVHGNQQVSFKEFPTAVAADLEHFKEVMSPSKIWVKALTWHAIQSCDEELAQAKASAEVGTTRMY